jgi:hypothetical protein
MKNIQLSTLVLMSAISIPNVHAEENHSGHDHTRPDSHAPIGVSGDHLMRDGEFMLTYRYMSMDMEGNRTDTDRVDTPLPGYMVSPLSMDMDMHMIGAMYAISDKVTLMAMIPYTSISMDHIVNMNGVEFTTDASGIGDVKLAVTYGLFAKPGSDFLFNFAVSAPTGSIDETDDIPVMDNAHLPYPMQLGSGTWDFTPGLTYVQTYDSWSWGAQGLYTLRTGENDNGYTLGDSFDATAWAAKQVAKSTSLSFRLKLSDWDNIDGADTKLLPMPTVPTKDPDLRGGTRVDALVGINFVPPSLSSLRLAAEVGVPAYQKLDGPQLETDMVFTLGAQYTF